MPTFIIHAMGQEPQKAVVKGDEITAGRSRDNDLVLPGDTISRYHTAFVKEPDGPWRVICTSPTNAIVVDGTRVESECELSDGTEILLGAEILLVFAEGSAHDDALLAARSAYERARCDSCGWVGMLSSLHVDPVCPLCSGAQIQHPNLYDPSEARREAHDGVTEMVGETQVRAIRRRLRESQRSRIERIDDQRGAQAKLLDESERTLLGKKQGADLELAGLTIGEGLEVWWNGATFMIRSQLSFPAMKINGYRRKQARLVDGDEIEVGKNQFRFSIG